MVKDCMMNKSRSYSLGENERKALSRDKLGVTNPMFGSDFFPSVKLRAKSKNSLSKKLNRHSLPLFEESTNKYPSPSSKFKEVDQMLDGRDFNVNDDSLTRTDMRNGESNLRSSQSMISIVRGTSFSSKRPKSPGPIEEGVSESGIGWHPNTAVYDSPSDSPNQFLRGAVRDNDKKLKQKDRPVLNEGKKSGLSRRRSGAVRQRSSVSTSERRI